MIRIDDANGFFQALVEVNQAVLKLVSWLVDWIVPRDPSIVFVSCSNLFPEPDNTVLVVLEIPKCCVRCRVVGMPVLVVAPWESVQVQNGINPLLGTLGSKMSDET